MNVGDLTIVLSEPLGDGTSRVKAYATKVTLRDLFAMAALAGRSAGGNDYANKYNAEDSYRQADAMLAERAKVPK